MSDPFSIPPETVTPGQLFMLLQSISAKQSVIAAEQKRQSDKLDRIQVEYAGMLQAWKTGGTVLRIVKWAAAVGAGIAAIWAFLQSRI